MTKIRHLSRMAKFGASAVAFCAAACSTPFDADAPSWLHATVLEADSTTTFEGSGTFHVPLYSDDRFSFSSDGTGPSEGGRLWFERLI